ncbi:MAG: hypothetical protein HY815_19130 [Candidatus Riflebacteria bacterium]|nr:hypothetical protein [Candidatus Riflebacteria bacterium]
MALLVVVLLGPGATSVALAAGSNHVEAMRVRRLVILDPAKAAPPDAELIVLPVSRGFDQRSTSLCWVYATLSGLESALRVRQPQSAVELSRRTMQVQTIEDRFLRKIHQTASYIGERGVAVDAMRLLAENGLVAFDDFTDIDDPYGSFDIAGAVDGAVGEPAKIAALQHGLARVYGVPPSTTHLEGVVVSRAALAEAVTAGQVWQSYAIANQGAEGYRPHPDPDARAGAVSWFMPAPRIVDRIKAALLAGYPLEITLGGHCLLLYGAAYDKLGKPTRYYIKDSYPGYFYKADPARVMENLVEMSTAKLPAPAEVTPLEGP